MQDASSLRHTANSLQDGLHFSALSLVSAVLCMTHGGYSWKFLFEGGQGLLGMGDEINSG